MRDTSLMAYTELDIPKAARAVLAYIRLSGPITGRAVSRTIPGGHKRLSWLKQNGLAENCGTTKDPITGRILRRSHIEEVSLRLGLSAALVAPCIMLMVDYLYLLNGIDHKRRML